MTAAGKQKARGGNRGPEQLIGRSMSETQNSSKIQTAAEKTVEMIREIANEEIDKALKAQRVTREQSIQELQTKRAGAREECPANAGTTKFSIYSEGGFVLGSIGGVLEDKVRSECGCRGDEEHDNRGAAILSGVDRVLPADPALNAFLNLVVSGLDELRRSMNGGAVAGKTADQITSPCVAESGAATPDAPAMTVSENTSAWAVAPSVPAHPRFVQLGSSVYDREFDRFLVAVNESGAQSIADELNEHPDHVVNFPWEDAK